MNGEIAVLLMIISMALGVGGGVAVAMNSDGPWNELDEDDILENETIVYKSPVNRSAFTIKVHNRLNETVNTTYELYLYDSIFLDSGNLSMTAHSYSNNTDGLRENFTNDLNMSMFSVTMKLGNFTYKTKDIPMISIGRWDIEIWYDYNEPKNTYITIHAHLEPDEFKD